jgi:FkbM family methyltransferase
MLKVIETGKGRGFRSYSNYGEDALLQGVFKRLEINPKEGDWSYIDLGAWKPISDSNTYFLYRSGMHGTVVEPNSDLQILWQVCRPKDSYLNVACNVGDEQNTKFYKFGFAGQSSTLDPEFADAISRLNPDIVKNELEVPTWTLERIIAYHCESNSGRFILDIDIEGIDFKVMKSYNFAINQRPSIILIETFELTDGLKLSEVEVFMIKNGYQKIGGSIITSCFIDIQDSSLREKINNAFLH